MSSFFSSFINYLVNFINEIGYLGIFIGMFLESTIVPIPSELIMIPAGIASAKGVINFYTALLAGTAGNILGALFSYYLSKLFGRAILVKIGKYFLIKESTLKKIDNFFYNHGSISVFIGRLLPGFRHFISIPAGIANMNLNKFFLYTSLGSSIWTFILILLGFLIGENQELIENNLHKIILVTLSLCLILIVIYHFFNYKKINKKIKNI